LAARQRRPTGGQDAASGVGNDINHKPSID